MRAAVAKSRYVSNLNCTDPGEKCDAARDGRRGRGTDAFRADLKETLRSWAVAAGLIAVLIGLGAGALGKTVALAATPAVTPQIPIGDQDGDGDVDLDDLAQRIRNTSAIGLFTKLSLKRDIDALERDLKAFHGGAARSNLGELHQRYDALVDRLMDLVQGKDPVLARDISRSKSALWAELADADEFKRLK
jgi:hypothetical protein